MCRLIFVLYIRLFICESTMTRACILWNGCRTGGSRLHPSFRRITLVTSSSYTNIISICLSTKFLSASSPFFYHFFTLLSFPYCNSIHLQFTVRWGRWTSGITRLSFEILKVSHSKRIYFLLYAHIYLAFIMFCPFPFSFLCIFCLSFFVPRAR